MITDIRQTEATHLRFVRPKEVHYCQDGVPKRWEMVEVHDSVAILLYHREHESVILVRQFRPPVYFKNHDGYTYELCAGIIDKDKSTVQIAQEEILEECGFDVPCEAIERVTSFYTAVGFAGSLQIFYYACVDESMRVSAGGGIEHEAIEVIELPLGEIPTFVMDETKAKTPGVMFGLSWLLEHKLRDAHDEKNARS